MYENDIEEFEDTKINFQISYKILLLYSFNTLNQFKKMNKFEGNSI